MNELYQPRKRLFGFYVSETETKPVSPAIIWDLAEWKNDKGFNHEEHEGHEV
ncbi:coenzyme F420-dependent N5,N10-methylene tetrahydromethanopterin reductase [Candidatus Brocadia sinica JPN1]|uniref:Coenzyme F420-dependent N5,N10-methylene tetrahydromethanopterin reductase n=1 Tax=Candidatus Brocadia sinica JPN1 TaxID=1197129 RepID=A0ABQ0K091_9BACT|nr:coenzyme F420-dependent N5,N10-methylene tetrahydromethanopterin reductase [Candidatus Brocadia sinica JPN1]